MLSSWLSLTCELYNAALQHRRDACRKGKRVNLYDQMKALPEIRAVRPEFADLPIVVLRGVLRRLDRAFAGFFRRCRSGEKPGYPRFRSRARWAALLIDDLGKTSPIIAGGKRVSVPLLGKVRFRQHRPLEGMPKAMRLVLECGRWFVTFACVDVPTRPLPRTGRDVGVDLGLLNFAATSDGRCYGNPRALAQARLGLERAQRIVSKCKRGSRRRHEAAAKLARLHLHVSNIRRENHIRVARSLAAGYDTIYIENLNVRGLARSKLARSVNDAAWSGFVHWLSCKAESAGREIVKVDPRGTSKTCSGCGAEVRKSLAIRVHHCPHCGLVMDRDHNAAVNILALGRSARREALAVGRPCRPEKINVHEQDHIPS